MTTRKRVNIPIDAEAHNILRRHKSRGETWSDVIKKTVTLPLEGPALVDSLKTIYRREKNPRRRQLAHSTGA